jgi:hypothetical protein
VSIPQPEQKCPHCGYVFNRLTVVQGNGTPNAGDFSVCAKCAQLHVYGPDLRVRMATEGDLIGLDRETLEAISQAQAIARAVKVGGN